MDGKESNGNGSEKEIPSASEFEAKCHSTVVLVVGSGDGGILRELSRQSATAPFIRCFFSELEVGFEDPRVHLNVGDAIEFLRYAAEGKYDAIIVDSSDPVEGPHVDFVKPINPVEMVEGADKHRRELCFYNSGKYPQKLITYT
ncbi:hypothetical protein TanjilG_15528 [Lupinus angustifolius]|nr:hypothetical protein TanjilG_15528 [Lupinus angustifolius]